MRSSQLSTLVVLDASPIIEFSKIGFTERFFQLCRSEQWIVVVTHQVQREIGEIWTTSGLGRLAQTEDVTIEDEFRQANLALGDGELSVLTAAMRSPNKSRIVVVFDDHVARQAAHRMGLTVWGTLRIIKIALERKLIDRNECKSLLERMNATGFRYDDVLLERLGL